MPVWYFTFGFDHLNPETGEKMKDYWVEVVADKESVARALIQDVFGGKWCTSYSEKDFEDKKKYFPLGCCFRYEIKKVVEKK